MSNIVTITDGKPVTTSLAIAEGVGNPHASVIKLIREHSGDFEDFGPLRFQIQMGRQDGKGGKDREYAILNEHQATILITFMRNIGVVKEFKKRLVKAFFQMRDELDRRGSQLGIPQSFSDALRLAADLEDRNKILELERDTAISTKAHIGSSREATAMARASAETRKANQLQRELGKADGWKQVKAIPWLAEEFVLSKSMYQQVGKKLTAISGEMRLEVDEIPSSSFGVIKSYHIEAINELWRRLQSDDDLLIKYRKGRAA